MVRQKYFLVKVFFTWLLTVWFSAAAASETAPPKILILGDSISAAYGLALEDGWVNLLQQKLQPDYSYQVVNASVSGETTAGGLARLPKLLDLHQPAIVVLELGGNDGLRGYPLNTMRQKLVKMVELSRAQGAQVLMLGMMIPPNYGPRYTRDFQQSFHSVAKELQVPLVPFLLAGVATNGELMQKDGIHPNQKAQAKLLANVWPELSSLLNTAP